MLIEHQVASGQWRWLQFVQEFVLSKSCISFSGLIHGTYVCTLVEWILDSQHSISMPVELRLRWPPFVEGCSVLSMVKSVYDDT